MAVVGHRRQAVATRELSAEPESRWWRALPAVGLGAVFIVAVVVMYRPTISAMTATLPDNLGDPSLNTWILAWEDHALRGHITQFFQGNIFHPFGDAIFYSEIMLPLVPVYGIARNVTGSWVTAHNVVILLLSLLCLTTTFLLTRRLLRRADVAVVAAIIFSFSGYVFMHQGHLQLLTLGLFPLAFLTLFRALERRRIRDGLLLGGATFLLTTACLYYGAVWFVMLGAVLLIDLAHLRWRPGRPWARTLAAAAISAGILLAPFAWAYLRFQREVGFERALNPDLGLKLMDAVTPAPGTRLYGWLSSWAGTSQPDTVEHGFFMGFVPMALAIGGAIVLVRHLWRRRPRQNEQPCKSGTVQSEPSPRWYEIVLLGVAGVVSLALAVGPTVLGLPGPFRFFYNYVPGFNGMKAVSRLAVPAMLAAAVLAALALDRVTRSWRNSHRWLGVAIVGIAILAELSVDPVRAVAPDSVAQRSVYDVLAQEPSGAVAELPIRSFGPGSPLPFVEGPRLLASLGDWRPRVNGFSGAFPSGYFEQADIINRFPDPPAISKLRSVGVRYVILHVGDGTDWTYSASDAARLVAGLPPAFTARLVGDAWLVDLGS